jgi:hypothetical protein
MTEKKFNFALGSRRLTENESKAVETAKRVFRESLQRHQGQTVAGHAVFKAGANLTATATVKRAAATNAPQTGAVTQRGTDRPRKGVEGWSSKTVASSSRKY